MTDVLIAGAGPVGLTMAAELARYGVAVRLIDRSPRPTETSKALVVWSRTLELMDRMGCTQAFLDAGLKVRGASIRSGGTVLGSPCFDDVDSAYDFALMVPQSRTEELLTAHLGSFGVAVERQVELTAFEEVGGRVVSRFRHADGREETVETAWLIGCDGAHSTVRHGLGLAFGGSAQGDDWLLADVRLEGEGAPPPDEIATYLHRDGPFVVFPIPGGRSRVVATRGKFDPDRPRAEPTLADAQRFAVERAGGGMRLVDPVWLTRFRINERKVADYRKGRVFLAGDAAHIHSPAGGQGMNTGMQDAINLAWKLALVQEGGAGAVLLDSYSPERSAVGDMVLRNAGRLTDMATLSHPAAQSVRNLALRFLLGLHAVRHRMATTMSEIDIAYPDSPLSTGPDGGRRWAPEHDGGTPPGAGDTPRFVLYATDAAAAALPMRYPGLLEPVMRAPPGAKGLFIVRPDGYVGLSAQSGATAEAARYLDALAADRP